MRHERILVVVILLDLCIKVLCVIRNVAPVNKKRLSQCVDSTGVLHDRVTVRVEHRLATGRLFSPLQVCIAFVGRPVLAFPEEDLMHGGVHHDFV